jgi:hypothetical protein
MTSYSDVPPEYSEEGYIFNADTWKSGTDKSSSSSSTTNGDFYVNKSGDIMTGNLIVPSINTSIITFGDSSTMDSAPNTASIEETATKTTAITYDGNTTISSMLKLTSNTSTQLQIYNQNSTNLMNISGLSNSFYFHNMSTNSNAGIYYQINGSSRLSIFPTYIDSSGYITIPTETAGSSNNRVANTQFVSTAVSNAIQTLQTSLSSVNPQNVIQVVDDFIGSFPTMSNSSGFDGVFTWSNTGTSTIVHSGNLAGHAGYITAETNSSFSSHTASLRTIPSVCLFDDFKSVEWIFRYSSASQSPSSADIFFGVGRNTNLVTDNEYYGWQYTGNNYNAVVNGYVVGTASVNTGHNLSSWMYAKITANGDILTFTLTKLNTLQPTDTITINRATIQIPSTKPSVPFENLDASNLTKDCCPVFRVRNSPNGNPSLNVVSVDIDYISFSYLSSRL